MRFGGATLGGLLPASCIPNGLGGLSLLGFDSARARGGGRQEFACEDSDSTWRVLPQSWRLGDAVPIKTIHKSNLFSARPAQIVRGLLGPCPGPPALQFLFA